MPAAAPSGWVAVEAHRLLGPVEEAERRPAGQAVPAAAVPVEEAEPVRAVAPSPSGARASAGLDQRRRWERHRWSEGHRGHPVLAHRWGPLEQTEAVEAEAVEGAGVEAESPRRRFVRS